MIKGTPERIITLLQAIKNGHFATADIMVATGLGRNGIFELGRLLNHDGLITREFIRPTRNAEAALTKSMGRSIIVHSLTDKGRACIDGLADLPIYSKELPPKPNESLINIKIDRFLNFLKKKLFS